MKSEKTALVVLNGDSPSFKLLEALWIHSDLVVCADGAAHLLFEYKKTPDVIIGDFDSISNHLLNRFQSVKLLKLDDQDTTDGEKALRYCVEQDIRVINIVGAFGDRLDHSLYNIELLKKLNNPDVLISCYTEDEKIYMLDNSIRLHEKPGTQISILPVFGRVLNVSTTGLEYEIEQMTLEFGCFSSISNRINRSPADIHITTGRLLVIIQHDLVS